MPVLGGTVLSPVFTCGLMVHMLPSSPQHGSILRWRYAYRMY